MALLYLCIRKNVKALLHKIFHSPEFLKIRSTLSSAMAKVRPVLILKKVV